jgi:hypothetical protein
MGDLNNLPIGTRVIYAAGYPPDIKNGVVARWGRSMVVEEETVQEFIVDHNYSTFTIGDSSCCILEIVKSSFSVAEILNSAN